jgi:ankyrin repeat protein
VLPSSSGQDRCEPTPELARIAAWLEERNIRLDPASEHSQMKLFYAGYTKYSWKDIPGHLARGIDPACLEWTPFMLRIAMGEATVAEAATQTAEEREHRDSWDRTPFLLAVVADRKDLTEALIEAGSDRYATGRSGMNALHYAARCDHGEMASWLLGMGFPADSPDNGKNTPLMTAAGENSLRAARVLLDAGANVHACDDNQYQAIHDTSSPEMIALLLAAGADVNVVSGGGDWALKDASSYGNSALVKYLLDAGANVDLTSTGETALFSAVSRDSLECVTLLLDAGANINAQDTDGWTCLWKVKSVAMAELLLRRGADPSIANEFGGFPEKWTLPPQVRELFRSRRTGSHTE